MSFRQFSDNTNLVAELKALLKNHSSPEILCALLEADKDFFVLNYYTSADFSAARISELREASLLCSDDLADINEGVTKSLSDTKF